MDPIDFFIYVQESLLECIFWEVANFEKIRYRSAFSHKWG